MLRTAQPQTVFPSLWSLPDPARSYERAFTRLMPRPPVAPVVTGSSDGTSRVLVRDGHDYAATDAVERHREPAVSVHYRVGRKFARDQYPISHECAESPPGQGVANKLTNASYFVAVPIELLPSRQIHRQ